MLDLEHTLHVYRLQIDYILIWSNNMFKVVALSFIQSMLSLIVCVFYLWSYSSDPPDSATPVQPILWNTNLECDSENSDSVFLLGTTFLLLLYAQWSWSRSNSQSGAHVGSFIPGICSSEIIMWSRWMRAIQFLELHHELEWRSCFIYLVLWDCFLQGYARLECQYSGTI